MRDVLSTLLEWHDAGKAFALARVISTWGSAPRREGATMLIAEDMRIAGSVSGGCIEGSVIEKAIETLKSGGSEVLDFGVSDETAWSVGLSCGGSVRVLVEPWARMEASFPDGALLGVLRSGRPCVLVTSLEGSGTAHGLEFPDRVGADDAGMAATAASFADSGSLPGDVLRDAFRSRKSREVSIDERPFFLHVLSPRRRLLVVGGSDVAVALLAYAGRLDFETIVVDPRGVFVADDRFATRPDRVFEAWPQDVFPNLVLDEDTFAVLLTHDPKIDDPALKLLLDSSVAYIGALGGRKTQEKRRERMFAAGFDADAIGRIHGPVGLDIDATTPAEIALSIMAEVIAVKNRAEAETVKSGSEARVPARPTPRAHT